MPKTSESVIDRDELMVLCEQRAEAYGWIARLFKVEVDEALLDALKSTEYPQGTGDPDLDLGYRKVAGYLSTSAQGTLLELAVDYVRTFIGHRNDTFGAAYPFESVYTSEKRLLMQGARNEVLAVYRKAGMTIDDSWSDPEDHVAIEMEYMQVMAEKTAQALREGDESRARQYLKEQRDFLNDHLLSWTPMLTADMRRYAKTGFYQGLAYLTDGFLRVDKGFFEETLDATDER